MFVSSRAIACTPTNSLCFARLECLDDLRIYWTPFPADWLELLDTLPPWTSVSIHGDGPGFGRAWRAFQDRRIAGLSRAPLARLRQTSRRLLEISGYPLFLKTRRGQPLLRGQVGRAEEFDLALLSRVAELEDIHIDLGDETEAGLRHLARLPNLRSLSIHSNWLNAIAPLASCTRLERLDISTDSDSLTDAGTEGLERLTALQDLRLSRSPGPLGDQTLRRLEPLRQLRVLELHLGEPGESISVLAGVPNLISLALLRSSVTDAALEHLTRLQKFRTLEVRGEEASITEARARQLASRLPEVTVILDDLVVKSLRTEYVFRRRLVGEFASGLFPVHWTDERNNEGDCLRLIEDGWEYTSWWADSRRGSIGLSVFQRRSAQSASQWLDRIANQTSHQNPRIIERGMISLAGADTASCVFRDDVCQHVVCTVIDGHQSASLIFQVAAERFEEFRRLFLFVARSLRVGDAAMIGVDETVTVAASDL